MSGTIISQTHITPRLKASFEVGTCLLLIFGYAWCILTRYPPWLSLLHGSFYICTLGIILYSKHSRRESLREIGFRLDNLVPSVKFIFLPTLMTAIVISIVWSIIFPVDIHFYRKNRFWTELLTYPCWGLFQQYIVLAFFFRRLKEIFFPHVFPAVFFSAAIFSAAHIPSFPLMIFCFITGLFWSWAYHRHCNLLTIAISHGVLGAICSNLLMMYMMVGPFADPARWTVAKPVLAYLDRVNTTAPNRDFPLVKIQKQEKSIVVSGWAKGIDKDIEKIFVSFAGKNHLAHYGIKRKEVEFYYKDPDYLHVGFRVQIPISHLEPDYYLLRLKIKLSSRNICHYPHRTVWVKIL